MRKQKAGDNLSRKSCKKIFRTAVCIAGTMLIGICQLVPSALEGNTALYDSYIYTESGKIVNSPAAYQPVQTIEAKTLGLTQTMEPTDLFLSASGLLYICDTQNNAIHIVDQDYQLVSSVTELSGVSAGTPPALSAPECTYVDEDERIYVADTGNQRIICIDRDGKVLQEYPTPELKIGGKAVQYQPTKLTVDFAGRIYVVAKAVNRGILEFTKDGEFLGYIGAPDVTMNMAEYFWRMISTEAQKSYLERYVPTEYNNVAVDSSGFIYATVGTVDAVEILSAATGKNNNSTAIPIRKLSPSGEDVLIKRGAFPPIGDLDFEESQHSIIADVALRENGCYSLLDSRRGRVFTYDMESNLLYIFGGQGNQFGKFQSASSLVYWGEDILVSDKLTGKITVFEPTNYASIINEAIQLEYEGEYDKAYEAWGKALVYNSNLSTAYYGIGKMEYRLKQYDEAMEHLELIDETYFYSKALVMRRKGILTIAIPVCVIGVVLIAVSIWLVKKIRKVKKS